MKKETATESKNFLFRPIEGLENNYLITDKNGRSHEMVELIGPTGHPAFMVDGKARRVFVGKYQVSSYNDEKLYVTQKNGCVAHSINLDDANKLCNELNNGDTITGFHLMTNAEWAAAAMMSHEVMKGERVQGNNRSGKDYTSSKIMGTPEPGKKDFDEWPARWLAGSGGIKTSHNGNESGIYDFNGNVWEWVKGLRLNDGEIQIIPNNDAALSSADVSKDSPAWRAILEDGSLVEPGTADTLKFNRGGDISKTTERGWDGKKFKTIECAKDVNPDCAGIELLKKLGVFPLTADLHEDYFWYDNSGENVPLRGGLWGDDAYAGLFNLYLDYERGNEGGGIGFRIAFVL